MKLVTAVVKPFKLEEVKDALKAINVAGLTTAEVRGFGRQGGHTETYRGAEYQIDFVPKVKVEVVVDDDRADVLVDAIVKEKPSGAKGTYLKKVSISSTMGPGVSLDQTSATQA